jgi:hypothetical protein
MVVAHFSNPGCFSEDGSRSGLGDACRDHAQCAMPGMFRVPRDGVFHCCLAACDDGRGGMVARSSASILVLPWSPKYTFS